jgi:hypothetical protein
MNHVLRYVKRARHLGGHRVRLCFDDGVVGDVDLAPFLGRGVFAPLKDPAYFAGFDVDHTLVWPNGADFAPEFLRERIHPATDDGACDAQSTGFWKETPPDREPVPHEVAWFQGQTIKMGVPGIAPSRLLVESETHSTEVDAETGAGSEGLHPRLVQDFEEWRTARIEELRGNVARLGRGEPVLPIEPLE